MSTLLESVGVDLESNFSKSGENTHVHNNHDRYVLKCKENIFKPKCSKALKRKLKKYKLRKDGSEDQDVLEVSKSLLSSLKIKSPSTNNKVANSPENTIGERLRPKNYLFKMGKHKQHLKRTEIVSSVQENNLKENVNADIDNISIGYINEESTLFPNNQEKKHTNAFKLMMDSRNKSIGSNSPGKEINVGVTTIQEKIEKREIRAKRSLLLHKMAEAKGSLKRQEKEEYQEECIKKKMGKRAERLKGMILKSDTKKKKGRKVPAAFPGNVEIENKGSTFVESKQLTHIFNEPIEYLSHSSLENKKLLEEDEAFLKKLSPSIRKNENIGCYFQKIEKKCEYLPSVNENDNHLQCHQVTDKQLSSKSSKKVKNKKLSLNKYISDDVIPKDNNAIKLNTKSVVSSSETVSDVQSSNERRKRKRKENMKTDNIESIEVDNVRPKRNMKKPVKYIDDIQLSSSDEELHIFTPKKKKHLENEENKTKKQTSDKNSTSIQVNKEINLIDSKHKKEKGQHINPKKLSSIKLAPIFTTKLQITPEASSLASAKQKFLYSGVPDKLKKVVAPKKIENPELYFHTVIHVQQSIPTTIAISISLLNDLFGSSDKNGCSSESESSLSTHINSEENSFRKLLSLTKICISSVAPVPNINYAHLALENIKQSYPKFPVYRTYSLLKSKKNGKWKDHKCVDLENSIEVINDIIDIENENSNSLNWTEKYKAMSTNEIIGNFESIRELRKWLVSWTENKIKSNNDKKNSGSDSSDYYQSDTDSRDSVKMSNNLLILTGPTGSGKTSSVYAVAAELAIKVIEVNASSKRTGKIMLQDLQEATQSHKVNRRKGCTAIENYHKSQEIADSNAINVKKRGRPKRGVETLSQKSVVSITKTESLSQPTNSQESVGTGMSLILIDDADIVFDQDDGFCSAIVQLTQFSKRPVILVTSSLECPHLQRFLQSGKIMIMKPLLPRMLGTWLDIMCLADNGTCWPGIGAKFLDFSKGDIRKAINYLQFYTCSYKVEENIDSQNNDDFKSNIADESSSTSWAGNPESLEGNLIARATVSLEDSFWNYVMDKQLNILHVIYPYELFNIWWSIPSLLSYNSDNIQPLDNAKLKHANSKKGQRHGNKLKAITSVLDNISVSDYLKHIKSDIRSDISAQPWFSCEGDSVSENENLDNFTMNSEIADNISHGLVCRSIIEAQRVLECEYKTHVNCPDMAFQRERDRIVSRHNSLTSYLNPAAALDRRALALDYWSYCRTICRVEKARTDTNSKRNNRFCHYLKSLKVMCKSDSFDGLCDSLCCSGES